MPAPTDRTAVQHAALRGEDLGDAWRDDPHVAQLATSAREPDARRATVISRRSTPTPDQGSPPMPTPKTPAPPVTLGDAGRAIWDSALDRFDVTEEEGAVILSTCQTADLVATLQAAVDAVGPIVGGKPNPLLVELRQQRIVLTRLVVSLRIPEEDDALRPQRRGGARGSYSTGGAR